MGEPCVHTTPRRAKVYEECTPTSLPQAMAKKAPPVEYLTSRRLGVDGLVCQVFGTGGHAVLRLGADKTEGAHSVAEHKGDITLGPDVQSSHGAMSLGRGGQDGAPKREMPRRAVADHDDGAVRAADKQGEGPFHRLVVLAQPLDQRRRSDAGGPSAFLKLQLLPQVVIRDEGDHSGGGYEDDLRGRDPCVRNGV
eukprot:scaffold27802_cov28-Tisochrysis_lutea.AAC.2